MLKMNAWISEVKRLSHISLQQENLHKRATTENRQLMFIMKQDLSISYLHIGNIRV
jgi:hypothetical protein